MGCFYKNVPKDVVLACLTEHNNKTGDSWGVDKEHEPDIQNNIKKTVAYCPSCYVITDKGVFIDNRRYT